MRITRLFATLLLSAAFCSMAQEPLASKATGKTYALRTRSGYYLTAENGGGGAINTDRTEIGPWETFTLVQQSPGVFSFRTVNGQFLSDMMGTRRNRQNRGGMVASKTEADKEAQFKLMVVDIDGPVVALVTLDGRYVTAENGGGVKARTTRAMSTDRVEVGEWEQFTLVRAGQ